MSIKTPDVKLPKIGGKYFTAALRKLSATDVTEIRKRTIAGNDRNLKPFVKYSKVTVAYKMQKGVSTGEIPTLMDTGKLLRGVLAKPSRDSYTVRLSDHAQIGFRHQTGDGVPKREWFGPDENMEKNQKRVLQEALNKEMKL